MVRKDPQVLWLHDPTALDCKWIGGKAMGLVILTRLGATVPEGFVVSTEALQAHSFRSSLNLALEKFAIFFGRQTRFAVRSSASDEDGTSASYAGMYQSFLNVERHNVYDAILACQRGSRTERVVSYRAALNRTHELSKMAVVVQRMLQPTKAGVCFTQNPVTGNSEEMIVEAVGGLCERLVSGTVTPDYYLLRADDGTLLDFQCGDEPQMGGAVLVSKEIGALWDQAKAISEALRWPVDLEFAFTDTKLYLVQLRPITTIDNTTTISASRWHETLRMLRQQICSPLGAPAL
jgi:phosphoenolpyruvate synthase/pyruvate phosphate dikinase